MSRFPPWICCPIAYKRLLDSGSWQDKLLLTLGDPSLVSVPHRQQVLPGPRELLQAHSNRLSAKEIWICYSIISGLTHCQDSFLVLSNFSLPYWMLQKKKVTLWLLLSSYPVESGLLASFTLVIFARSGKNVDTEHHVSTCFLFYVYEILLA